MEKANSSREDSEWSTLDRNILAIVFDKLDIMDITMGASRDLMFVAERMPNIEKLALPVSLSLYNEIRVLGRNCSNLNNLKLMGYLENYDTVQIVRYLQSLKRLSLQCSEVYVEDVISLIRGLGNLTILNLTHCRYLSNSYITRNHIVQAATHQKLEKLIMCSRNNCRVCQKERPRLFGWNTYFEKYWRNDEIKELEF
ncbi:PREDICTED: putative F-box protein At4g11580 [Camelina sativa]|uniref:F-box protein At4g11580 n=1 Tax=Camelina sativa TaxID=90675 RepID=A0ABM1QFG8_CAMSA|nr:PREDICTED: putative F-box protein At4g11580 [Camelina sativa]